MMSCQKIKVKTLNCFSIHQRILDFFLKTREAQAIKYKK